MGGSFGAADSFPKDFGYGEEEEEAELEGGPGPGGPGGGAGGPGGGAGGADSKPRILLMGLRRSGKSSIQKVRGSRRLPAPACRAASPAPSWCSLPCRCSGNFYFLLWARVAKLERREPPPYRRLLSRMDSDHLP